jgi:hypothetical protein
MVTIIVRLLEPLGGALSLEIVLTEVIVARETVIVLWEQFVILWLVILEIA